MGEMREPKFLLSKRIQDSAVSDLPLLPPKHAHFPLNIS